MHEDAIQTVLFDLDGTLADTAPDLAYALNRLLIEEARAPLPLHAIRPVVSSGSIGLIRIGFGLAPGDAPFALLRERLLDHYAANLCRETRLFPGMAKLLTTLHARGIGWGIVTNKPAYLTGPLVEQLAFAQPPACVISGDTLANRKPHPQPLLHACTIARTRPARTLFVGDAERDIQAGRAAGMKTLVALFGYIEDNQNPLHWGADGAINTPWEILRWIDAASATRDAG